MRFEYPIAMRPIALLILLSCSVHVAAQAQEAPRALQITEGYLAYGSSSNPNLRMGLSDWRAMLPGSALLARDMSGLSVNDWYGGYWGGGSYSPRAYGYFDGGNSTGQGYVAVGLDLNRNTEAQHRFEQRLRVGVGIIGSEDLYGNWSRTLRGTYDTLISQQTGQMIFLDSSWTEGYSAYAYRSRAALDLSYVIRRVSASRWSWYAGAGLQLGFTHSGRAETSHYTYRRSEGYGNQPSRYEQSMLEEESFRLKGTAHASGFALLGVDFRLGRTSPFWSHLHLFTELRPSLQYSAYPGLPSRIDSGMQNFFGMRIDLR